MHRSSPAKRLVLAVVAVVALTASQPAPAGGALETYVAMGDSFTAGPGIPIPQLNPTGCLRSTSNYPNLVAQARGSALRDPSCSGATTRDLSAPQSVTGGVNPPQLDSVDATATAISVQIGGNDIGFSEIIQQCVTPLPQGTPCQDRYTAGGVDEISRRITSTGPKMAAVLAEATRRAPAARVFVVGYPAILPEGPTLLGCWPAMPVAPGDIPYLRDKEKELNAMLAREAAAAGATYVDVYTPSIGHDACQLPGIRWVEPLVPASPAAPVHPNLVGMQGMAAALAAAMSR